MIRSLWRINENVVEMKVKHVSPAITLYSNTDIVDTAEAAMSRVCYIFVKHHENN